MPELYSVPGGQPGRNYCWVYRGNRHDIAMKRAAKYRIELWDLKTRNGKVVCGEDGYAEIKGVAPVGGMPTPDEQRKQIEVGDFILMSCSDQIKADIEEYGIDGVSGQAGADIIEDKLIKHKRGQDPLRGLQGFIRGHHMDVDEYEESGLPHGHTKLDL